MQRVNADQDIIRRQAGQFIVGEDALHGQQSSIGSAQPTCIGQQFSQGRKRSRHDAIEQGVRLVVFNPAAHDCKAGGNDNRARAWPMSSLPARTHC